MVKSVAAGEQRTTIFGDPGKIHRAAKAAVQADWGTVAPLSLSLIHI